MRLAIILLLALTACGKKQAPKAPAADTGSAAPAPAESAAPAPAAAPGGESGGGAPTTKSDPEEGGQ
jgi:hypothetical protein